MMLVDDDNVLLPGILAFIHAKMKERRAIWYPFVLHDGSVHPIWVGDTEPRLRILGMKVVVPVEGAPPEIHTSDGPLYQMAQGRWPGVIVPCFGQLHYATHASRETWELLRVETAWSEEQRMYRSETLKPYEGWPT